MGDCEHDTSNSKARNEQIKAFVDRVVNLEADFSDVKAEYKENIKDLKTEIKSREDETGIPVAEVIGLAKIRLDELAAKEEQETMNANMDLYSMLYGFAPEPEGEEEDPALD